MSLLDFDLLIATLAAFGVGLRASASWRLKLGICLLLALLAWAVRIVAIVGADINIAEDYLNGLGFLTGTVELLVALAWTFLWCGIGTATAWAARRLRTNAR